MARRVGSRGREGHHLALTVHGPLGSIDLLVPPGAAATDVAREYAAQAGLGAIPLISTQLGQPLAADVGHPPIRQRSPGGADPLRR